MRRVSWSEPCQEFATQKRFNFGFGESPESVVATKTVRLRRAGGGDCSKLLDLATNMGDAAADSHRLLTYQPEAPPESSS